MRHRKHTFKIGRRSEHIRSLLANQAVSLITEERIRTTVTKAKETRRLVERMITLGKGGTLHQRRLAISRLRNVGAVHKLFAEIAPRYLERAGGYTRIIRLGQRLGDAAEMCYLEFVEAGAPQSRQRRQAKAEEVTATAPAETAAPAAEATPAAEQK
jgi:large subunit ribosomal protein L17